MQKINTFLTVALCVMLSVGMAFATDPNGSASGNFNINTLAIGGGVDSDSKTIVGGAAGGFSGAGGFVIGEASGKVSTITVYKLENHPVWKDTSHYTYSGSDCVEFSGGEKCTGYFRQQQTNKVEYKEDYPNNGNSSPANGWVYLGDERTFVESGYWKNNFVLVPHTIAGGTAEGKLITTGGGVTKTEAYTFNAPGVEGIGSYSDSFAESTAKMELKASGIASVQGVVFGAMGQGSIDGSVIFNPDGWNSTGVSGGVAGQGAVGAYSGGSIVALCGQSTMDVLLKSSGFSQAESFRSVTDLGNGVTQETLGTNVSAKTTVESLGSVNNSGLATGSVNGGWVAGGIAAAHTSQVVDGGVAKATVVGGYSGSGSLGQNYTGSAEGYAVTSSIQKSGYNGTIMTSAANMKVTSSKVTP